MNGKKGKVFQKLRRKEKRQSEKMHLFLTDYRHPYVKLWEEKKMFPM